MYIGDAHGNVHWGRTWECTLGTHIGNVHRGRTLGIAEMTNISVDQVKVYIFRARRFLKQYIGKMEVLI